MNLVAMPHELQGLVRSIEPSDADPVLAPAVAAAIGAIVAEHRMQDELEARGLAPIRRALWHGPTGTGKTTAAALVARQLELPLLVVPMDTLVDSHLGGTSARLRKVLEHVGAEPGVVLLDEIDAIGLARGDHNDVGEQGRIVTTLLVLLDDLRRRRSRTLFIAATNRYDALDPALVRRFDQVLAFPLPTEEERVAIAAGVFLRARVPGARASLGDLASHADVERWALGIAKQQVLQRAHP